MGEDGAYAAFVRTHADTLYRTSYMLTGRAADAEELLQDTLAHLYPRWHQVQAARSPLAYVRTSLANRLVSTRRRPSHRDLLVADPPDGPLRGDLSDELATRDELWRLLGALPRRQRAALVLRSLYDLPDDEVAQALGCRVATVRSLASRGAATIRRASADPRSAEAKEGLR